MFFDWLSCYQDFPDVALPIISDDGYCHYDFVTNELGEIKQSRVTHEGSYSTSIVVHVKGSRVYMSGNPSKFNRLDNLFGYPTLEQCFEVYNGIAKLLGLPPFTKCSVLGFCEVQSSTGAVKLVPVVDGAVITTVHITANHALGFPLAVDTYLRALSALPFRRSRGRLHSDGKTVDWISILGNARDLYASVYNKAYELRLHTLPLIKRKFGLLSDEYQYLSDLIDYCDSQGVARSELKFNYPFLKKHNYCYYGLFDISSLFSLFSLFNDFISIDSVLQVTSMDIRTITQTLIEQNICTNTKSANLTALCALNWMNGQVFDLDNRQNQRYRARLRKIGIDIARPYNLLTFSPVIVKKVVELEKRPLQPPSFYRYPALLLRKVS